MLTIRHARAEASFTLLGHLRENARLAHGLALWAVALLSIAALGSAASSVGMLAGGLV